MTDAAGPDATAGAAWWCPRARGAWSTGGAGDAPAARTPADGAGGCGGRTVCLRREAACCGQCDATVAGHALIVDDNETNLLVAAAWTDTFPSDRAACLEAGTDAFLDRPPTTLTLAATIADVVPAALPADGVPAY